MAKWLFIYFGVSPLLCQLLMLSAGIPDGSIWYFPVHSEDRAIFDIATKNFDTGLEVVQDHGDYVVFKKK